MIIFDCWGHGWIENIVPIDNIGVLILGSAPVYHALKNAGFGKLRHESRVLRKQACMR